MGRSHVVVVGEIGSRPGRHLPPLRHVGPVLRSGVTGGLNVLPGLDGIPRVPGGDRDETFKETVRRRRGLKTPLRTPFQ